MMRVLTLVCFLFGGCMAFEPLPRDPVRAKAQIGALVPDGTPGEVAKKTLEKKGLKCSLRDVERPTRKTYLYGSADRPAMPMVSRGWLIHFEVRDGRVYEPWVGVELTGP